MKLREIAHSRTGDKGNTVNISVILYDQNNYEMVRKKLSPQKVKNHFRHIVKGNIIRYDLPKLGAFNFVMYEALSGGVTRSLALDKHGKSLSSFMLELEI